MSGPTARSRYRSLTRNFDHSNSKSLQPPQPHFPAAAASLHIYESRSLSLLSASIPCFDSTFFNLRSRGPLIFRSTMAANIDAHCRSDRLLAQLKAYVSIFMSLPLAFTSYGASGVDLTPYILPRILCKERHRDFRREIPSMLCDLVSHICSAVRARRTSSCSELYFVVPHVAP